MQCERRQQQQLTQSRESLLISQRCNLRGGSIHVILFCSTLIRAMLPWHRQIVQTEKRKVRTESDFDSD